MEKRRITLPAALNVATGPKYLTQMASIFRLLQPHTVGFITYSEGCNDDVNKFAWSGLGWNPDAGVTEILRDYSR